jgi:hypothetical protein
VTVQRRRTSYSHQRARDSAETTAFSYPSTVSNAFVIEYLLQINFTNFPQEGHLTAAISPYSSGIVALGRRCDRSVPVA